MCKIHNLFIFIICMFIINHKIMAANSWHKIAHGVEYQEIDKNSMTIWSHIYAFRIDLKINKLSIITAKDMSHYLATANQYAKFSHALLTINGGFFDKNHSLLGLRIRNNQQLNPLRPISWWGIFYIENDKPYITNAKLFTYKPTINFAIQSGPRILINQQVPTLKSGYAERSAIGITNDGKIILLVTNHYPMTTTYLAHLMQQEPLNCVNALNLDGGSSSQLYADVKNFHLDVPGFSGVSDAIIVKAYS